MKMAKLSAFLAIMLLFSLLSTTALAQADITDQLNVIEKLRQANVDTAESTLRDVSFLIAFLGGVLSFLAPCTVALFPAFLAYTTKAGRNLTLSTLIFFAGFSAAFIAIGVLLTSLGRVSFVTFQQDIALLIRAAGIALIGLGILALFGRGFSFMRISSRLPSTAAGTFFFGAVFAVGWSACIGPIIAGIFTMAAVFHNYAYTAFLLFFYALGLSLPLFAAAFAYDKFRLDTSKFLQGFSLRLRVGSKEYLVTPSSILTGVMLILIGLFFIFNQGTTAITAADLLGMIFLLLVIAATAAIIHKFIISRAIKSSNLRKLAAVAEIISGIAVFAYFTSRFNVRTTGVTEQLSRAVLEQPARFAVAAAVLLALFLAVLAYFVWRQARKIPKNAEQRQA